MPYLSKDYHSMPAWFRFVLVAGYGGRLVHCLAVPGAAADGRVPVFFDSSNHVHRDRGYHPECPARITACVQALAQMEGGSRCRSSSSNGSGGGGSIVHLVDVAADDAYRRNLLSTDDDDRDGSDSQDYLDSSVVAWNPFTEEQIAHARAMLLQTHEDTLITGLQNACTRARHGSGDQDGPSADEGETAVVRHWGYADAGGDTFGTTGTWGVVLRATAAWMRAVDEALLVGTTTSTTSTAIRTPAMALTRPPGHHATWNQANGFCWVNFAVTAALHSLLRYPDQVKRVSILDWDVHYGQGVADLVEHHSAAPIRYASIHQVPAFPYMGQDKKTNPQGNVLTLPMPPDTTWACGYQDLFSQALDFLIQDEWEPELVIVCAGYDALGSDDLASCALTAADFGSMTRALRQRLPAGTALVLGLEGGYQLKESGPAGNLPQAVVETVRALVE